MTVWDAAVPKLVLLSNPFSGYLKSGVFSKDTGKYCICKRVQIPYDAAVFKEHLSHSSALSLKVL
jgi:hypothetical protein